MMHAQRKIWRDGQFIPWEQATVHVLAQSLQRGTLAFDYMSVHDTDRGPAIFRVRDHMARLSNTCAITGLQLGYDEDELVAACAATVRENPDAKSLKISALIPSIEVELIPQDPQVSVFIAAYDPQADVVAAHDAAGHAPLHTTKHVALKIERHFSNRREDIIPPQAKVAANYTSPMMAKQQARREGFDDVLLLNEQQLVAEAPTSNIFIVDDGQLLTPPSDKVLLGITRDSVMQLAAALGIACAEQDLTEQDLKGADEVFLTATSVGVWPVVRIDQTTYGNGAPGPVTERLADKHRAICRGADTQFGHWLHYVN